MQCKLVPQKSIYWEEKICSSEWYEAAHITSIRAWNCTRIVVVAIYFEPSENEPILMNAVLIVFCFLRDLDCPSLETL